MNVLVFCATDMHVAVTDSQCLLTLRV